MQVLVERLREQACDREQVAVACSEIVAEQWLVVSDAVAQLVEPSDGFVDGTSVGSGSERRVQSRDPEVVVMTARGEVAPEAEPQFGDDLARWDVVRPRTAAGVVHCGIEEPPRGRVGVVASAVGGLSRLRREVASGLEDPVRSVGLIATGEGPVVGVAQRDFEVPQVVVEGRGERRVPFVELECAVAIALGRSEVDGKARGGQPVLDQPSAVMPDLSRARVLS
ncbi:hypothetical protein [Pseudonocardia halophobica]|uniref:hypothetical protein n=1 Tax=Pseudonocardia halophobica TaxID=29401 RepID=UPI000B0FCC8D